MSELKSSPPRLLVWSVRALAALSAGTMVLTRELNPVFILIFVAVVLIGFLIEGWSSVVRMINRLQPVIVVMFFIVAILDFMYLSRSFLLAVAHSLLTLQGLRLLALRTVRDHVGSILISSMMILSASTLSVEWSFFVCLILFLPLTIWNLILLNLTQENQLHQVQSDPHSSVRDIDLTTRGLFEFGYISDDHPHWRKCIPIVKKATALGLVVAIGCCGFVFLVFPRLNFHGFHAQFLQPVAKSGFTNQVNLDKEGSIFQDSSIVMRVEIRPYERSSWPGYLRGSTLNYFDGRIWSRGTVEQSKALYKSDGVIQTNAAPAGAGKRIRQGIYLESMESTVLFGAPIPINFKIDRPIILMGPDRTIERWRGDSWRLYYELTSLIATNSQRPFLGAALESKDALSQMLILPKKFELSSIHELAQQVIKGKKTNLEKAEQIENFLQTKFSYSLDLGGDKRGDPLHWFLFNNKKGNCEYFSSAMCVMLRTLGIPSRMVTGFYAHEWNQRGGYYVVRMSDAHAWVEAFIQGRGWYQFDPTPRTYGDAASTNSMIIRLSEMADYLNLQWNRYILSYDLERQAGLVQMMGSKSKSISLRLDSWLIQSRNIWGHLIKGLVFKKDRTLMTNLSSYFIVALLLMIVALSATFFKRVLNRGLQPKGIWFYEKLLKILRKKGFEKRPSQTLKEFIDEIKSEGAILPDDLAFLAGEYYSRRFDPSSVVTPEKDLRIKLSLEVEGVRSRHSTFPLLDIFLKKRKSPHPRNHSV